MRSVRQEEGAHLSDNRQKYVQIEDWMKFARGCNGRGYYKGERVAAKHLRKLTNMLVKHTGEKPDAS